MVHKESPLCSWCSAFGCECAEALPACLINLLSKGFGDLSLCLSPPATFQIYLVRRKLLSEDYVSPLPYFLILQWKVISELSQRWKSLWSWTNISGKIIWTTIPTAYYLSIFCMLCGFHNGAISSLEGYLIIPGKFLIFLSMKRNLGIRLVEPGMMLNCYST
jgi:hypothetical protein